MQGLMSGGGAIKEEIFYFYSWLYGGGGSGASFLKKLNGEVINVPYYYNWSLTSDCAIYSTPLYNTVKIQAIKKIKYELYKASKTQTTLVNSGILNAGESYQISNGSGHEEAIHFIIKPQ